MPVRRPLGARCLWWGAGRCRWAPVCSSGVGQARSGDLPQRIALSGSVVAVVLGHAGEAAFEMNDGEGGVGGFGQIAGEASAAEVQAVLVVGGVADMVQSVLDFPTVAVEAGSSSKPARSGPREARPKMVLMEA